MIPWSSWSSQWRFAYLRTTSVRHRLTDFRDVIFGIFDRLLARVSCVTNCHYHPRSDSVATVVLFSVVSVCGCVVCLSTRYNSWTVRDIIVEFLWEQDMVKNSDEIEYGCIPMFWQIQGVAWGLSPLLDNLGSATAALRWWFNTQSFIHRIEIGRYI